MEQRYSWGQRPDFYYANYYNDIDIVEKRIFIVIDNESGQNYLFPNKFTKNRIIIDEELWNQEFFNWACSTAPDFCSNIPKEFLTPELIEICLNNSSKPEFIKEVFDLTKDQCEKFVKRLPFAIEYVPNDYKYEKCAKELLDEYPALLIHFPLNAVDPVIRTNCYDKVSVNNKILFIEKGCMNDPSTGTLLTSQMLMDLIEDFFELVYRNNSLLSSEFWEQIPANLFTEEICLKLVENCADFITIIPQKFYEIAVKHNSAAFKYLDDKYKTYEMCLEVVTLLPELIKEVPINILNENFVMDLKSRWVVIPKNSIVYVDQCVQLNKKLNGVIIASDDELKRIENEIPLEIKDVSINNLSDFFNTSTINQFNDLGISNLGELFVRVRTNDFLKHFMNLNTFEAVVNTICLLRCKCFDEKPLVSINNKEFVENEEYNFYRLLGLTERRARCLALKNFCHNSQEFFEKLQLPNIKRDLMKINELGPKGVDEIIAKANIVINYYLNNNSIIASNSNDSTEEKSLKSSEYEELHKELQSLREEKARIDNQIDMVLEKIQSRIQNKDESGVAKL